MLLLPPLERAEAVGSLLSRGKSGCCESVVYSCSSNSTMFLISLCERDDPTDWSFLTKLYCSISKTTIEEENFKRGGYSSLQTSNS